MNAHLVSLPVEILRLARDQRGQATSGERYERSGALIVAVGTLLAGLLAAWI